MALEHPLVKYIPEEFDPRRTGNLKIGTFSEYRKMEGHAGQDELEGIREIRIFGKHLFSPADARKIYPKTGIPGYKEPFSQSPFYSAMSLRWDEWRGMSITERGWELDGDFHFQLHSREAFVFCTSLEDGSTDSRHSGVGKVKVLIRPDNAENFFSLMRDLVEESFFNLYQKQVPFQENRIDDDFVRTASLVGQVRYTSPQLEIGPNEPYLVSLDDLETSLSPLLKDPKFVDENEFRFAFIAISQNSVELPDFITIPVEDLLPFIEFDEN